MISHVNFMITNKCNSNCRYCYVNAGPANMTKDLELDKVYAFLDTFKKYGGYSMLLTGGEALLYPDIEKVIKRTQELDIKVALFTNGIALNKDKLIELLEFVDSFAISLDGPEEVHNHNRGVNNAYQSAIQALELFKENDVNYSIQMTINKSNLEYIDFVGEIAHKYMAKNVKLAHMHNQGRGTNCDDFLTETDLFKIKEKAVQLSKKYKYRPYFRTNLFTEKEIDMYCKSDIFTPHYWIDHQGDLCLFSTSNKEHLKLCNIAEYPEGIREEVFKDGIKLVELANSRIREQKICSYEDEMQNAMVNLFQY